MYPYKLGKKIAIYVPHIYNLGSSPIVQYKNIALEKLNCLYGNSFAQDINDFTIVFAYTNCSDQADLDMFYNVVRNIGMDMKLDSMTIEVFGEGYNLDIKEQKKERF